MDFLYIILLLAGGLAAGVANTLAGGGSLLTVPLLILAGVPPASANATNRIGVVIQSITASWTLRDRLAAARPLLVTVLPAAAVGALAGAFVASQLSDRVFRLVFGLLMLPLGPLMFRKTPIVLEKVEPVGGARLAVAFGLVGLYAGSIQAGYGLFAMAVLRFFGHTDLITSNALKNLLSGVLSVLSLGVFVFTLQIHWAAGAVLAVSQGLGGYLGGLAVIRRGEQWIRPALLVACLALAVHMLVTSLSS